MFGKETDPWLPNSLRGSEIKYQALIFFCKRQSVTLYFPKCELSMVINCSFYREDLKISVTCGDINRNSEVWGRYSPEDYLSWKKEEVTRAVLSMKAVIDILQGELGETFPSITITSSFGSVSIFLTCQIYLEQIDLVSKTLQGT